MIRVLMPSAASGELVVTAERFHHLVRVLRVAAGDELEVFDGQAAAYPARVLSVSQGELRLLVGEPRVSQGLRQVTVLQGLPRAEKLELVIQKGTELGATGFVPLQCERSVVKVAAAEREKKRERWQKIAAEAARQCGRADVPRVWAPCAFDEGLAAVPGAALLVLDEEERSLTLSAALATVEERSPVALVVGPEGGLSRREVDACLQAGRAGGHPGPLRAAHRDRGAGGGGGAAPPRRRAGVSFVRG